MNALFRDSLLLNHIQPEQYTYTITMWIIPNKLLKNENDVH